MVKHILIVGTAFTILLSCEKKEEKVITRTPVEVIDNENTAQNSLDILGTYKGVLPCADCEGIETEITLIADETYIKKTKYLGKDNNSFQEMGSYSWKTDGNTLVLEGIDSEPEEYLVRENSIMQLDMQGNKVTGDLSEKYILKKEN
ncbi:MAG: copper resistance protein NlpE [Moheibacter sp.]